MYKETRITLLLIFVLCSIVRYQAQITANPSAGCAPLAVQLSGPAGATNVFWSLGSQGTTTLSTPNPIFTSPGNVLITYTAMLNGAPVSYTRQLVISTPPSASFSYVLPANHCLPLTASFVATGVSPGSSISWAFGDLMPLGYGTSVQHTYLSSNNFVPVAIITDAVTGCTAVVTPPSPNSIPVSAKPIVNIVSSLGAIGCVPPFVTSISGNGSSTGSPLGGGLNYSWQMLTGVPAVSSASNPGNVSFGQGIHTVQVVVTDNNQCSQTGSITISVVNPTLTAIVPSTVCINSLVNATVTSPQSLVTFSMTSINGPNTYTLFPNATTIFTDVCQFTVPGPQQMTISVQAANVCPSFKVVKQVFVEQVVASFTSVPPFTSCQPSMTATFVNSSTVNSGSTLSYSWWPSWGNITPWNASPTGTITTNVNQNVTFTLSAGSQNPYTIFWSFNPVITLYALSQNGCNASAIVSDHILTRTTARFKKDKREGCAPLTVMLRDTSYVSPLYPVTSWTWSSGQTPPLILTGTQVAVFTYTAPGTYVPSFTIQTAGGCRDTFRDTVIVGLPPVVSASAPSLACIGVPVTVSLTGTSGNTPPGAISHWHVTSDLNYFSGCISNPFPTFPFTHIGTHSFAVTAYEKGCSSTTTIQNNITVSGAYGQFVFATHCQGDKNEVDFEVHIQDGTNAILNYGDGSPPQVINAIPGGHYYNTYMHAYPGSGNYVAVLTSSNTGSTCLPHTYSRTIKIRHPVARITFSGQQIPALPQALACTKSPYKFSGLASTENEMTCKTGYKWWFKGPGFEIPPVNCTHGLFERHNHGTVPYNADDLHLDTFRVAGIYTISLEVKDVNGCPDTCTKLFRISSAAPVYTFVSNPHCYSNGPIQFINTTQNSLVVPDIITSYTWQYGDNTSSVSGNALNNPVHQYPMVIPPSQTFQILAIAKNQLNCIDSTYHTVQINNPSPQFNTGNFFPCIPKGQLSNAVGFSAMAGYPTYSFSTGSPTNNPAWQTLPVFSNIIRYYSLPGSYIPTLTVIDNAGCKASNSLTITALGQPTAVIKDQGRLGYCAPAEFTLRDTSKFYISPITGYQWGFGTILSPFSPTRAVFENILTTPGIYTIALTVGVGENYYCPNTTSVQIIVFDTQAKIELDKTVICLGDRITVKATGLKDVYAWQWFFGDLVPQPLIFNTPFASNPVVYNYNFFPPGSPNGKTTLVLKAISDNSEGCVRTESIAVQVIQILPDFKEQLENYRHCLSKESDTFTSTTPNPLALSYQHHWAFGTGATSSVNPAVYNFSVAGVYPVTLTVKDAAYSCTASAVKNMTILPLPKAFISSTDSLLCPDKTFTLQLKAEDAGASLISGLLSPFSPSVFTWPASNTYTLALNQSNTTIYNFSVLDSNRCESRPVKVEVQVPAVPPAVHVLTTAVIGQSLALHAPANGKYSYHWQPERRYLNDTLSATAITSSTADITYSVIVMDEPAQCWRVQSTFSVIILPYTTIDVPSAFTPNGDGINDLIFPDGWGIRRLNYFRIYNRWGQLLFETNEYRKGWDGTFEGIPQNMDSYIYQAEVETYLETAPLKKSSTFKLIR